MNELDELRDRVWQCPRGIFFVNNNTRFHFYQVVRPYLEHAWMQVVVQGWKTDWTKAAKHVLLSFLTAMAIDDTRKVPQNYMIEIVDWLREETEEKRAAVALLLRREMSDVVWDQADQIMLGLDRQYYRREPILSLAGEPT